MNARQEVPTRHAKLTQVNMKRKDRDRLREAEAIEEDLDKKFRKPKRTKAVFNGYLGVYNG